MLAESLQIETRSTISVDKIARRKAVKRYLRSLGMTLTRWSAIHGYSRYTVYKVLSGELHGHYGVTHNIAVRLRLKDGEIDEAYEPLANPNG